MMPRELQGAHPVGQVADLQLVGQGEERDAGGQRVLTTWPDDDGTVIYTPFPDFEREVAGGGGVTERTSYTLAGQLIAVRVKVSGGSNELYYTYTDHLGSVAAMSYSGGTYRANSLARYDPFGNHRTLPGWIINPGISDRGFTGHIHDNTGAYPTQNIGLIYMNARYYLPEIGRFISADSIVPEPGNPQSYNRYSYSYNNPIQYTDSSGHMPTSSCDGYFEGCLSDRDPDTWQENYARYMVTYHPDLEPIRKLRSPARYEHKRTE